MRKTWKPAAVLVGVSALATLNFYGQRDFLELSVGHPLALAMLKPGQWEFIISRSVIETFLLISLVCICRAAFRSTDSL